MNRSTVSRLALVAALVLTSPAWAAKITVNNLDGAGEGLNDATVVATVTGNDGTTLGQQRLNALIAAANTLGARLNSSVEIFLDAKMDPLPCDAGGAILGGAGANTVFGNFPNAYVPNTWYHAALANSIADYDLCIQGGCGLNPVDMSATFNSDIDNNPNCLAGTDWYYGVGATAPAGTTSLYETALHELVHGLGFSTFVDLNDPMDPTFGDELGMAPDIYETFLEDHSTGMNWPAMNSAERATSAVDTGDLHWNGCFVRGACSRLETGHGATDGHVDMYAPAPFEAGSSVGHFSDVFVPDELMEPIATDTFEEHMTNALLRDIGWSTITMQTKGLGDVNGGGFNDVAMLVADLPTGEYAVYVMDGDDGSQIQKILLPAGFYAIDMEIMDSFDATAAEEIAVLLYNPGSGAVQVRVYDASDATEVSLLTFSKKFKPADMEIMANFADMAAQEVAVAGRDFAADRLRVTVVDGDSGTVLSQVYFSKKFNLIDMEIVPNFALTAADEIAMALRSCADNTTIVDVKDGSSGVRHVKMFFAKKFIPFDMEVLANTNGIGGTAAAEVAVAGKRNSDSFVKIRAKDAGNGVTMSEVNFPAANEPIDFEIIDHFSGSPAQEYALVARKRADATIVVKVKDGVSGANLTTANLSPKRAPQSIGVLADNSGNNICELPITTLRQIDNERRAVVIDASSGNTVSSIGLP